MTATLSALLDTKGHKVWTISSDKSAYEALELMAEYDVGALVVTEQDKVAGMFSERDYARKVILRGKSSKQTLVAEVMTKPVCYVLPWTSLSECMNLMTTKRVRHLPVMENDKLLGIVTIGDVIKTIITEQQTIINELKSYIDSVLETKKG